MKRKLSMLLLTSVLALSTLAGCGDDEKPSSNPNLTTEASQENNKAVSFEELKNANTSAFKDLKSAAAKVVIDGKLTMSAGEESSDMSMKLDYNVGIDDGIYYMEGSQGVGYGSDVTNSKTYTYVDTKNNIAYMSSDGNDWFKTSDTEEVMSELAGFDLSAAGTGADSDFDVSKLLDTFGITNDDIKAEKDSYVISKDITSEQLIALANVGSDAVSDLGITVDDMKPILEKVSINVKVSFTKDMVIKNVELTGALAAVEFEGLTLSGDLKVSFELSDLNSHKVSIPSDVIDNALDMDSINLDDFDFDEDTDFGDIDFEMEDME